jgi:hypothetical protein
MARKTPRTEKANNLSPLLESYLTNCFMNGLVMVPGGGVEPPRPEGRRILSPLRLPVPPSRL